MSDTTIDFEKLEANRVMTSGEEQILADWDQINAQLVAARATKRELSERIKSLVALRREKAKLVRLIDPSRLKPDTNGDE